MAENANACNLYELARGEHGVLPVCQASSAERERLAKTTNYCLTGLGSEQFV